MKTVEEVFHLLDSLTEESLSCEKAPLLTSLNRIVRTNIVALEDQPPFDRSSIDGYLVRRESLPGLYRITETHRPGNPAPQLPDTGCTARIFTGSALPSGAALVMQEDTRLQDHGAVEILKHPSSQLIRPRASQCRKGETLVTAPSVIRPGTIGLLASLGVSQLDVSPLIRVAHLATGKELVDPGQTPSPGQVRDSNSPLIASLVASFPARMVWQNRVGDDRQALLEALGEAVSTSPHLLLVSGASSVGDQDHTASALEELGFQIHARQVRLKPGKPLIVAQKGEILAFGLPGNPLSHFVCYHLFVRRVLRRWSGLPPSSYLEAALLEENIIRPDSRETWWPGRMELHHGQSFVRPLPWQDSSDLTCLVTADGLIRVPAGQQARSPAQVLPTISP